MFTPNTLHLQIKRPRVLRPRTIKFETFSARARQLSRKPGSPLDYDSVPKAYWIAQVNLWNSGVRDKRIHGFARLVFDHLHTFPMGH